MNIEITAKKDGKEIPLSDISTTTFEKLKAEKPCEKPKELQHGDYGKRTDGFIYLNGKTHWLGLVGTSFLSSGNAEGFTPHVTGNLKDDLERNSKDLEEWTGSDFGRIHVKVTSGNVNISIVGRKDENHPYCRQNNHVRSGQEWNLDIRQATELGQVLIQGAATLKKMAAKKDC